MDTISDREAEFICQTISRYYATGGYPLDKEGKQVGWYDWLRSLVYQDDTNGGTEK